MHPLRSSLEIVRRRIQLRIWVIERCVVQNRGPNVSDREAGAIRVTISRHFDNNR